MTRAISALIFTLGMFCKRSRKPLGSTTFAGVRLSFAVAGIEHLNGNGLDNFAGLQGTVSGIAIDLLGGNDTLSMAGGRIRSAH